MGIYDDLDRRLKLGSRYEIRTTTDPRPRIVVLQGKLQNVLGGRSFEARAVDDPSRVERVAYGDILSIQAAA
jgi:hypothetical protein